MADQAGFARLWHELYERLDTGRAEDAQRMAAAWALIKTRDYKTGEFTLGPRYLEKRFNISHGAAGRLIQMVSETENRLGQHRANGGPIAGHESLEARESPDAPGPRPGHDRASAGPIYRRVDGRQNSPSESVAANGDNPSETRTEYQSYLTAWNEAAEQCGWAKAMKLSNSRRKQLQIRLKDPDFDWNAILEAAKKSAGLRGKKWFGLDWLLKNDQNYLKVLEGKYEQAFGDFGQSASPQTPSDDLPWASQ